MSAIWLVIIIVVVSIFFIKRPTNGNGLAKKKMTKRRVLSRKTVRGLMIGYGVILVVATVVYYLLPNTQVSSPSPFSNQTPTDMFSMSSLTQLEHSNEVIKNGQKVYKYIGSTLKLTDNEQEAIPVLIERKATNDHTIDVYHFTQRTIVNQVDITQQLPSPKINLHGVVLQVSQPKKVNLKFATFDPEFTITQFFGGSIFHRNGINYQMGQKLLYLRIPKNLQIIKDKNIMIKYVG